MIKFFGFCIKAVLFSLIVLVLGNWIKWDGKTLSQQVHKRMTQVEKSPTTHKMKGWTQEMIQEAKEVAQDVTQDVSKTAKKHLGSEKDTQADQINEKKAHPLPKEDAPVSDIPASERQKLKALIRELNSSPQH